MWTLCASVASSPRRCASETSMPAGGSARKRSAPSPLVHAPRSGRRLGWLASRWCMISRKVRCASVALRHGATMCFTTTGAPLATAHFGLAIDIGSSTQTPVGVNAGTYCIDSTLDLSDAQLIGNGAVTVIHTGGGPCFTHPEKALNMSCGAPAGP